MIFILQWICYYLETKIGILQCIPRILQQTSSCLKTSLPKQIEFKENIEMLKCIVAVQYENIYYITLFIQHSSKRLKKGWITELSRPGFSIKT